MLQQFSAKWTNVLLCVVVVLLVVDIYAIYNRSKSDDTMVIPEDLRADVLFQLGQYYFNHDDDPAGPYDIEKAQLFYEEAVAKDPLQNNQAWYQLGRTYFIQGDFDSALEKFDKQIELFGQEVPNVYYMIGLTYGYKARSTNDPEDWKKGEEAFLKFVSLAPLAPWSRVDLAWLYFAQGKYEAMFPVLEEGLLYRPDNAWLLNMYGLALLNTGEKEKAHAQFTKALEIAVTLTPEDWGESYPGNSPDIWKQGLSEFRTAIEQNVLLTQE